MDTNDDLPPSTDIQALEKRRLRKRQLVDVAVLAVGAVVVMIVAYVAYVVRTTPSINDLRAARNAEPSKMLAADGSVLAEFSRSQQTRITLKDVSPFAIKALIDTEDHRFYQHGGVDFIRTAAGAWRTLGGDVQGGSTITQQLARNLFPEEIGRERTLRRKFREMVTSLKIERAFSKDEILESYLNTMPFLYNVTGIEMAARTYFNEPASALDAQQSATLIGMLKGTYYYNPIANPERALARRNVVLAQMRRYGDISPEQYAAIVDRPLDLDFNRPNELKGIAPHFAAYVSKWLTAWADENDYDLYADGLIVQTTLDPRLQEAATQAVERQAQALQNVADVEWSRSALTQQSNSTAAYSHKRDEPFRYFWNSHRDLVEGFVRDTPEYRSAVAAGETPAVAMARLSTDAKFMESLRASKTRLEAGFVAIDPVNGEVKVWVGSRDFMRDQYDHVAVAERQPGSTFKPIVYGAALERGMTPDRRYYDMPVEYAQSDGTVWRPTDMSGSSGDAMTMSDGLVYSKNTITAQVMQEVGVTGVMALARAAGIKQSRLDPVPSLALGTSPVTLLEMATAYATIADSGKYHQPVFVTRITDRQGNELARFGDGGERALSEDSAVELIDMMRGVVTRGTGQAIKTNFGISADVAGKTGTTQNNTDGWFFLMHPDLVAGAWVGFNDSRVTMRSNYWGQGGHNAVLLVGDFFRKALSEKLVDAKLQFRHPLHPQIIPADSSYAAGWDTPAEGTGTITVSAKDSGTGNGGGNGTIKIIHLDNDHARVSYASATTEPEIHNDDGPKSAVELDGILSNMGRDPATGVKRAVTVTQ